MCSGMVIAVVAMLSLVGCTPQSEVVEGSNVRVAVSQPFTSYNPATSYGSSSDTNRAIHRATNASFAAYDATPKLDRDESLGTFEVVSDDPLVVTYTLQRGIRWSDGVEVDAADLLLAWAANSGALNDSDFDASEFVDPQTGRFTDEFPRDAVYFDGFSGNGLQLVSQTPVIGDDGRSVTLAFDEYFADFALVFDVGLPAHIVAGKALRVADPEAAKVAVTDAIASNDRGDLARLSRFWNSGFTVDPEGATEPDLHLFVGNGPYTITEVVPGESVTLTANPEYRGDRLPHYERVVVTVISDPLQAVAALDAGEVDVIAPQTTQDVMAALDDIEGVTVRHGFSGTWEKLDLQQSNSRNGHVENELVRRAFLKTVPRDRIVDELIRPLDPNAQTRDSLVFLPGTDAYEAAVKANNSRAYSRVDIAGAKRMLARAGRVAKALERPTICVLFDPANPRRVAEYQLIKDSAADAGIRVTNCSSPDWRNLLGTPGSYDAALYALGETNLSMAAVQAAYSSTSTLNNHSRYASDAADSLIEEAAGPVSAKQRIRLLSELDRLLWRDAVGLPLYQFPTVAAVSDDVLGFTRSPFEPTALSDPWRWEPVTSAE
jgi:peptide/nickel transport system substrate-binding protein